MGLVVLAERPGWVLASDSKVIEPFELLAIEKASHLMHSVESYATRILRSALKVYDERANAGFKSGEQLAKTQVSERLCELEAARSALIEMLRPSLTELLLDAMGKLARSVPRDRLYASALAALEDAWRQARWAKIYVNPVDVEAAEKALAEIVVASSSPMHVGVFGDHTVAPTGCRFESDLGFADAGLDVQLKALHDAFSEGLGEWGASMSSTTDGETFGNAAP